MLVRSYVQLTNAVPGTLNKRRVIDKHGLYRAATEEFADGHGFKRREMWAYFVEFVCMREYEMKMPRELAEWFALQDLHACFAKQGEVGN